MSTVDELGDEIATLAIHIDVATHRLLECVRGFDEECGWAAQGAASCAHWLSWRIGLDPATAREKVRVARALGKLPAIDGALKVGKISYAKARALTRVATPENEANLLEMAMYMTGAQLERLCRGHRGALDVDNAPLPAERDVRRRDLPGGMVKLEVVLLPDEADLVLRALDRAREVKHADESVDVSAESAPGKAWARRMTCRTMIETLRRNPAGQARPAKAGNQPEPSVAWFGGNPDCEAYTGSMRAAR